MVEITMKADHGPAAKVFSNVLKGNPPFKPWKGMEGCSWFGYAGDPNPGMAAANKPVTIRATIVIPANVPRITGAQLEAEHDRLMHRGRDHGPAEGDMWHNFVGKRGLTEVGGLLSVEVGGSRFSRDAGRFLLVNNNARHLITMTAPQIAALEQQMIDGNLRRDLVAKQEENERTHGRTVTVFWGIGIAKSQQNLDAFWDNIVSGGEAPDPDPSVGEIKRGWETRVHYVLTYSSYLIAKREARRMVGMQFQGRPVHVEFGENGVRWQYKGQGNVSVPPMPGPYRL